MQIGLFVLESHWLVIRRRNRWVLFFYFFLNNQTKRQLHPRNSEWIRSREKNCIKKTNFETMQKERERNFQNKKEEKTKKTKQNKFPQQINRDER